MGTFNSSKTIAVDITALDSVEIAFRQHFENAGYTVSLSRTGDGFFASITNTNIFKVVLGMKTSLNVEVKRVYNGLLVDAKVGVFGQQIIPSVISLFVLWPVLFTQIAGLVKQSKLDDEAIQVIEEAVYKAQASGGGGSKARPQTPPMPQIPSNPPSSAKKFCPSCGAPVDGNGRFCSSCGTKIA